MGETLEELEQRRASLYQQMQALGDFRPGTISVNFRRCGEKGCACAQFGHPGHGPQYLWNTTSGGQSRAQNLRLGPELEKAQRELENHQIFLRLWKELVGVNEKICRLRPAAQIKDAKELEALRKNCRAVLAEAAQEIDRLVQRAFRDIGKKGNVDLGASEMAIRAASHRIGGPSAGEVAPCRRRGISGCRPSLWPGSFGSLRRIPEEAICHIAARSSGLRPSA
jgi:hypothetical protein